MRTKAAELVFVEAPMAGSNRELTMVPMHLIQDVPAPISKVRQESLEELGQIQPVRLRPVPGGYEIVDGRRRVANLKAQGAVWVEALVEEVDDITASFHSLALNISGSHNPMFEAREIEKLLGKVNPATGKRFTQKEIAGKLGVTQGVISQRISLLKLIEPLRHKLEMNLMTLGAARMALKLPASDQERLAGLDKVTVKAADQELREYQAEEIDLSSLNLPTAPRASMRIGLNKSQGEELTQAGQVTVNLNGIELTITLSEED